MFVMKRIFAIKDFIGISEQIDYVRLNVCAVE